jgi:uncharacterized protein (TIRG00374 family)
MKKVRMWVGPALGVIVLVLVLRRVDFQRLFTVLAGTNYFLVLLAVAIAICSYPVRAFQWIFILRGTKHVRFFRSLNIMMIGFLANGVLPARMGEFVRSYAMGRKEQIGFTTAFATVVVARVLDCLTLIALFIAIILTVPFAAATPEQTVDGHQLPYISPQQMTAFAAMAVTVFAAALVFILLVWHKQEFMSEMSGKVAGVFSERLAKRVRKLVLSLARGFGVLGSRRDLALAGICTVGVWAIFVASTYPMLKAFPFQVEMPWYTPLVLIAVISLGLTIPAAPGYTGTFHAACVAALWLCNPRVDYDLAVGFALVLHAAQILPTLVIGSICLWAESLSLGEIMHEKDAALPDNAIE